MEERPFESWRSRAAVSEALDAFNSSYMQDVWTKALARRETDPEGAVTSARTLLEAVCKHILDEANSEYREGAPLPKLYEQTATVLDMAPNEHLAPLFNTIFKACAEVVAGIGQLRNELSDSHGRGPFGAMPNWRHAELAVNLSGAMATYLSAVWKGRQPTVNEVVQAYLKPRREEILRTTGYSLERMGRELGDLIAAKLRPVDLVAYFEERAANGIAPATLLRDFGILRRALGGLSAEAFATAAEILRQRKIIGKNSETAVRRIPRKDFDAILQQLRQQGETARDTKHTATTAGMTDLIEFAVWSGRNPIDIMTMRWSDVDFNDHTCKLPGKRHAFPVLERAWEIIEKRRTNPVEPDGRIFPFDRQGVVLRHLRAIRALVAEGKIQTAVRFQDYRHEAAHRLLEEGHSAHVVARATGLAPERILKISEEVHRT